MNATVSPQTSDVEAALRSLIQGIIGGSPPVPVILGLGNRVPMPEGAFIAMTIVTDQRLATNFDTDTDGFLQTPAQPGITSSLASTKLDVQFDFYGPNSHDWAKMVGTLFRDDYACEFLGSVCQPLYADDARLMPLITAEDQYLERWMLLASIDYQPVVVTGQTFSTTLDVVAKNVDAEFPPSGATPP